MITYKRDVLTISRENNGNDFSTKSNLRHHSMSITVSAELDDPIKYLFYLELKLKIVSRKLVHNE